MTERRFHPVRDYDLSIARAVRDAISSRDDHFVLTGSYSIEALTKGDVIHNDIDGNVFTRDIPRSMARVGLALASESVLPSAEKKDDSKSNRLEYEIVTNEGVRDLELQFVQYDDVVSSDEGLRFTLPDDSDRKVVIPTVTETLGLHKGGEEEFRVKSISFAIATWALRISGIALSQKRSVRQSDIDHFAFLAQAPHKPSMVAEAMRHHPQMPTAVSPERALELAIRRIDNS